MSGEGGLLLADVEGLVRDAVAVYSGTPQEGELRELMARLGEPLRVAIAGRVKAGKSTLLNALVGQELAPTDAGESTRIVTWYRNGVTYRATLHLVERFTRLADDTLDYEMKVTDPSQFTEPWKIAFQIYKSPAEQVFFEGLDLCKIETVTLQYDRDTKKTTALIQ